MTGGSGRRERALPRVATWVLVVLTALFAVSHLVLVLVVAASSDERRLFLTLALLQLLGLVVLLLPYRRRERWAWWASWIPIVALVATLLVTQDVFGVSYAIAGAVLALAQLAALPAFRTS